MKLVRVVFEEQARGLPRIHQRDCGQIETLDHAALVARSVVVNEEFQAGTFVIYDNSGNNLGTLDMDLQHHGANWKPQVRHA